jgi:ubiquinone/menaquinone biosynthesis C-methylase UbiE
MWSKILWHALKRNGWAQLFFYLSNLDIWRFIEYSHAYQWIEREANKNNSKIVDLGGGYSIFPSFFPEYNYTVVDLSAGACRYQQSHGTNSICADITSLPFDDDSVSTVIAISSIEHVPADEKVYREIARVLTDGGVAVITVPFSATGTYIVNLQYPRWMISMLRCLRRPVALIIGQQHLDYFLEQTKIDAIMKCYNIADLQEIVDRNELAIVESRLIGKRLVRSAFRILPPGWLVLKDLLVGWPLFKLEQAFLNADTHASGIVIKARKKRQGHGAD